VLSCNTGRETTVVKILKEDEADRLKTDTLLIRD
jgi:hypothetical protein